MTRSCSCRYGFEYVYSLGAAGTSTVGGGKLWLLMYLLQSQLPLGMLETRIKLRFMAKPAEGAPPLQAEAWLYVLPSGKPASL